jgi:hypothetical protein
MQGLKRLLLTIGATAFVFSFAHAQRAISPKDLLIEATQTQTSYVAANHKAQYVWVRLKKDGSLEWQEPSSPFSGEANKFHSSRIDVRRAALIQRDLNSIDWTKFVGEMGPYYRYVDSRVEIQFHIVTSAGEHKLTVINPWPHWRPLKAMPSEISRTICELDILRTQAGDDKVNPMCEDTLRDLQCSEGSKPCVKQ